MHIIAKNIKQLRQERNWTQQEMADMLYVTRQTVSNWENGKAPPDVETLLQIAEKLDIDVNQLVYGKNDTSEKLKKDMLKTLVYLSASIFIYCIVIYLNRVNSWTDPFDATLSYVPYFTLRPMILFFSGVIITQILKITGIIKHTKGIGNIGLFKKILIGLLLYSFASCFEIIRYDILYYMYTLKVGPFAGATSYSSMDWALTLPGWIEALKSIPHFILCSGSRFYKPPYYLLIIILGIVYELARPYSSIQIITPENKPQ